MKISLSSHVAELSAGSTDFGVVAAAMKAAGFDAIDFSMCDYGRPMEWLATEDAFHTITADMAAVKAAGIEIGQCHLPYLPSDVPCTFEAYTSRMLPLFQNCLRMCGAAGCPIAVIHLYFEDDAEKTFEANVSLIRELMPLLYENNVTLAIENIYAGGSRYLDAHVTKADDMLRYMEAFNDPHVALCLDVGHAIISKNDPIDMVYRFGRHLVATHIHSTGRHDNHTIPGTNPKWLDPVDYDALSKALGDIGYTGTYNLEVGHYYSSPAAGKLFLQLAAVVARHYGDRTGL